MTKEEAIKQMRQGLDELCTASASEPEWQYLNAIRFVECYRIMRALERDLDK